MFMLVFHMFHICQITGSAQKCPNSYFGENLDGEVKPIHGDTSFMDLVLISDVSLGFSNTILYNTIQSNYRGWGVGGFSDFFLMLKLDGFDWVCFLVFAFC